MSLPRACCCSRPRSPRGGRHAKFNKKLYAAAAGAPSSVSKATLQTCAACTCAGGGGVKGRPRWRSRCRSSKYNWGVLGGGVLPDRTANRGLRPTRIGFNLTWRSICRCSKWKYSKTQVRGYRSGFKNTHPSVWALIGWSHLRKRKGKFYFPAAGAKSWASLRRHCTRSWLYFYVNSHDCWMRLSAM